MKHELQYRVNPTSHADIWIKCLVYPLHTAPTTAGPVVVGTGLAILYDVARFWLALAFFVGGWLVHTAGLIWNNYANLRRQSDDPEHRVLHEAIEIGTVSLQQLRNVSLLLLAAGGLVGLVPMYYGGLPAIAFGLFAALGAYSYSSGPYPLKNYGLSQLLFFSVFGLAGVAGSFYVQAAAHLTSALPLLPPEGSLPAVAWLAGVPPGALITNILTIDDIRDVDFDRPKGEASLAVRFGARWCKYQIALLNVIAYIVPFIILIAYDLSVAVLLPLLSLPGALLVLRQVWRGESYDELLSASPRQGMVTFAYCLLFATGLALG